MECAWLPGFPGGNGPRGDHRLVAQAGQFGGRPAVPHRGGDFAAHLRIPELAPARRASASRMVAGNPDDIRLFAWYLQHGPWSVVHGRNPLYFATMNAPAGVNGMWNTSLLLPALLLAPVTALAGPLAAYNLLFLLGLAAGPVCALAADAAVRQQRLGRGARRPGVRLLPRRARLRHGAHQPRPYRADVADAGAGLRPRGGAAGRAGRGRCAGAGRGRAAVHLRGDPVPGRPRRRRGRPAW